MFLKKKNIISKIKRSKVTDYAALSGLSFYVNKCKILHIGKENSNSDYQLVDKDDRSTNLTVAKCEKTLAFMFNTILILSSILLLVCM